MYIFDVSKREEQNRVKWLMYCVIGSRVVKVRVVPRISNFLEAGSRQGSLQEFLAFGGKRQKVETLAF